MAFTFLGENAINEAPTVSDFLCLPNAAAAGSAALAGH